MTAREQYEQFDEWLAAKYREVVREWHAATCTYNPYVQVQYEALLKNICREITWIQSKLGAKVK